MIFIKMAILKKDVNSDQCTKIFIIAKILDGNNNHR